MRPISLRVIKAHSDIWEVRQDFLKLGKYPITIRVIGFTRREALNQFEEVLLWESQPDLDPLKALYDTLWITTGALDGLINSLSRLLTSTQIALKPIVDNCYRAIKALKNYTKRSQP